MGAVRHRSWASSKISLSLRRSLVCAFEMTEAETMGSRVVLVCLGEKGFESREVESGEHLKPVNC